MYVGNQTFGKKYFDSYTPVVTWLSIRILFLCDIVLNCRLREVDFIIEYSQDSIESDMYLHLPEGIETDTGNSRKHVIKLLKNLYSQNQDGKVWADFLSKNLFKIGF